MVGLARIATHGGSAVTGTARTVTQAIVQVHILRTIPVMRE
ncbi:MULTISPECIES: hypothetical protein [Polymorphospora]|uniref:Uncharacterized protein n=1 Tax=Polymorphospora lycopeni TaxID=3140240 RepID=A0ABV5CUA7_9ACTN